MAIVHCDNFSMYGGDTAKMLNGVYAETASVGLATDPDGLSPGYVMKAIAGAGDAGARYVLQTPTTALGMAWRWWLPALPGQTSGGGRASPAIQFRNGSNTPIATMFVTTTGQLSVVMNTSDTSVTPIGTTTGPVITANGWWHIEIKFVADPTAGSIEIRVEGVPKLVLTGLNTGSTPVAQMYIGEASGGSGNFINCYYKDLVVWDTTGSINTSFLGSVVVVSLTPDSDVALPWNSTGANGWSILANGTPGDDVSNISAVYPPPAASVFTLSNLPLNVTSVKALMTMVRAKKADGGDGNLQTSLVSTTNTTDGANRPITAAYTYWRDVFETDPDTSAPWTVAATNAVKMKLNRTA